MIIFEHVLAALLRALEQTGFELLERRELGRPEDAHVEVRAVRGDRLGLEPAEEATITLGRPRAVYTSIVLRGHLAGGEGGGAAADLAIGYHLPFPAYLELEDAVLAAAIAREHLLDELLINLPPGWEVDAELAAEVEINPFGDIFSVHCMAFQGGSDQQAVEIILDHSWVYEASQPAGEAELEGEMETLASLIAHVWEVLVPPGHEHDPLAPLSFLLPLEEVEGS